MKALQHAASFVKQQVALGLNLRHAPHLHFARDTVEENAARIDRLLGEVRGEKETNVKDEG
jgi:ribosome-binding factor A